MDKPSHCDEPVVISSLVVETLPDCTEAVKAALQVMEGVEVHEVQGRKIVITIEAGSLDASQAIASRLAGLAGATGVQLVYVNCEEDPVIARARETRGRR